MTNLNKKLRNSTTLAILSENISRIYAIGVVFSENLK
ncbi:hypothetical protein SAMN05216353_10941 [Halobacillus alkaliphilus]|uniref:Uncharacterized protein n=1 Tax=Halobacillus alkaliphilus TaxID=396056 RepID=A0A1I2LKS1_9BACI|nr:hypothetical protein SAMN05216353_10941 [Halobacillus alkaliphilus]